MKFLFTIFLFFIVLLGFTQNLVPNPSFEDTVECPIGFTQINLSNGWTKFFSGSPDYFNKCSLDTNIVSVPINSFGVQMPSSSQCNAYAGIYVYLPQSVSGREFIGRQLSTPLTIGQKYYASFKTSLADKSRYAINKLGILFSTVYYDNYSSNFIKNNVQIKSNFIISNKSNWITITDSFIADSTYQYIIIGNFYDNSLLDSDTLGGPITLAYYYIDDVCVSMDSTTCNPFFPPCNTDISEIIQVESITIFPNPFFDKTIVQINSNENFKSALICIYDVFGRVMQTINTTDYIIEISKNNLPAGIYFLTVSFNNKLLKQKIVLTN